MRKFNYLMTIMALIFLVGSPVFAQTSPDESTKPSNQVLSDEVLSEEQARAKAIEDLEKLKQAEQEKKKQAELEKQKQTTQQQSKPKQPKKVFKPTEEISEDLPVPFPVDI